MPLEEMTAAHLFVVKNIFFFFLYTSLITRLSTCRCNKCRCLSRWLLRRLGEVVRFVTAEWDPNRASWGRIYEAAGIVSFKIHTLRQRLDQSLHLRLIELLFCIVKRTDLVFWPDDQQYCKSMSMCALWCSDECYWGKLKQWQAHQTLLQIFKTLKPPSCCSTSDVSFLYSVMALLPYKSRIDAKCWALPIERPSSVVDIARIKKPDAVVLHHLFQQRLTFPTTQDLRLN